MFEELLWKIGPSLTNPRRVCQGKVGGGASASLHKKGDNVEKRKGE